MLLQTTKQIKVRVARQKTTNLADDTLAPLDFAIALLGSILWLAMGAIGIDSLTLTELDFKLKRRKREQPKRIGCSLAHQSEIVRLPLVGKPSVLAKRSVVSESTPSSLSVASSSSCWGDRPSNKASAVRRLSSELLALASALANALSAASLCSRAAFPAKRARSPYFANRGTRRSLSDAVKKLSGVQSASSAQIIARGRSKGSRTEPRRGKIVYNN